MKKQLKIIILIIVLVIGVKGIFLVREIIDANTEIQLNNENKFILGGAVLNSKNDGGLKSSNNYLEMT